MTIQCVWNESIDHCYFSCNNCRACLVDIIKATLFSYLIKLTSYKNGLLQDLAPERVA